MRFVQQQTDSTAAHQLGHIGFTRVWYGDERCQGVVPNMLFSCCSTLTRVASPAALVL